VTLKDKEDKINSSIAQGKSLADGHSKFDQISNILQQQEQVVDFKKQRMSIQGSIRD
jgi:hypothetical protein